MEKLLQRLLYNPKFFLGAVSGVGLIVLGLWSFRSALTPPATEPQEPAAPGPVFSKPLSAPQDPSLAPKSAPAQAKPADVQTAGARLGSGSPDGPSLSVGSGDGLSDSMPKDLPGRADLRSDDKKAAKALETQPVTLASSKPTGAEAEREAPKDETAGEDDLQKDGKKLQSLDKLNQRDYAPGAAGGGAAAASAPALSPKAAASVKAPAEKPKLQAFNTAGGPTSITPGKGFFRSSGASSGRTLRTGGPGGFRMPGEGSGGAQAAAPAGEAGGSVFAMAPRAAMPPTTAGSAVAAAAGGAERGAAAGYGGGAPANGGAAGGGVAQGNAGGGGGQEKADGRAAAKKEDIAKQAKKHLAAANSFKSGVVLAIVKTEWGQSALPALKQKAAAAQARMESLDAAVQADIPKFTGYPSVVSALTDTHYLLAGRAGRDDGNFIGRLKASQSNVDAGLRDVALLPDACGYQISVPKPRALDPVYPRAGSGDLSAMGFQLSTPRSQDDEGCSAWYYHRAECEPRTYGTEYVHDSAIQAHQKLGYAVDQTITVRADALQAADIVSNELSALETSLRNHMRPDLLAEMRSIGQRVRTDLQAAAGMLPNPQTVSPAVNMAASAQSAGASRQEIQGLFDDLNDKFPTYPNTGNRRDAQFAAAEAKDNVIWTENNLKGIRGTGAEPLKALIEAGGQAAKTLVSMCDSYLAMDRLAGEAKQ